jgi:GNAT superfamily N-acetyltransferase
VAVVAVSTDNPKKIVGYYTLSAGHVQCEQLPPALKSKIPQYPVPIARIGRLAVDQEYKGQGIGAFLLHDACSNALRVAEKMGVFAVVVDAKNEEAKAFYSHYGFSPLENSALTLILPIKTIQSVALTSLQEA